MISGRRGETAPFLSCPCPSQLNKRDPPPSLPPSRDPAPPSHPQVNERGPKELEKRQKRVGALQEALSNGINTEIDLQRLQASDG